MKLIVALYLIFLSACTTTTINRETQVQSLDVGDSSPGLKTSAEMAGSADSTISAEAAFNWQAFFKGPPNSKERPVLQQTLKQLSGATSVNDLMKRGRNEFSLGLLAAAESSFRQAIRKEPKNIDALIELSATLQRQRRIPAALDVLAEAKANLSAQERADKSQVFRYRYTLAMTYLANDDRTKAHSILSDLIGKDKTFLPGYAALSFSYLKDNKDTVAKFIVDQALDRGEDSAALYNILGILAERQGKNAIARDNYNRALAISESYSPALVNRGNLHLAARETAMAESDYKKALDADPSSSDAMIGLGVVQRLTGRFTASRGTFERVIEMDADNPQARFNLAVLMRENLKDEGQALRYFNEVTQSERANQGLKTLAKAAIEEIRSL